LSSPRRTPAVSDTVLGGAVDDGPSSVKAAIDIGTNSMHLVVARLADHGGFEILTSEKDSVRLGQGGGEMKLLAPDAIERGITALARMAQVATSFGEVDLVAVATSAVREASNRDEFLDRARDEVGIEVEVISGFEEARLIHLGVLHALPIFDRRVLLVDIGGGSTEFVVGQGAQTIEARSMKLGAIRLTERFFSSSISEKRAPTHAEIDECRHYVRAALAPVGRELGGHQPELAIGSSGTASTIGAMAVSRRGDDVRQMNGVVFSSAELEAVVDEVLTASDRRKVSGLDDKRTDIILGGAVLLHEVFRTFDLSAMTISDAALREGVLFDRFASQSGPELQNLRRGNIVRLAQQLDPDPEHAVHTAHLATELFDRLTPLHGLGAHARELLDAAAVVHNVGLFISHSSHHKHSYYVIRNSEQLTGFTEHEVELIAVIARYHRKSLPTEKHMEFAALSADDRRLVRTLAGMLRVAIGLDRRHAAVVTTMRVIITDDAIRLEPIAHGDIDLEIYAAHERSRLLADTFERRVVIEVGGVEDRSLESS
jgi:exopolyphosphatase/guanosine-5'-triphosphate,3'-diphosphate pyrophosphatase